MTNPDHTSIESYLEQLEALPWVKSVHVAQDKNTLVLKTPTKNFRVPFLLSKSHLSNARVKAFIDRAPKGSVRPLIFAPYIGEPVARDLIKANFNFLDQSRNSSLEFLPNYYVRTQGRGRVPKQSMDTSIRAAGYQVLLALISNHDLLTTTVRQLAEAAGTSRHPAHHIPNMLIERGFAVRRKKDLVWIDSRWDDLIDMFVEGYLRVLRPHLLIGHFQVPDKTTEALQKRIRQEFGKAKGFAWTGASAEAKLTKHYQSDKTIVHLAITRTALGKALKAIPTQKGPLTVLRPALPGWPKQEVKDVVPPILVYAELLAEGNERAREAAGMIRDDYLGFPLGAK